MTRVKTIETIHSPFTVQAWIENFDPLNKKDFLDFLGSVVKI